MGAKNGINSTTLCWDCHNAVRQGCSWAQSFTPVKGWTADKEVDNHGVESYVVRACPEFIPDQKNERSWQELDDEGCVALISATLELARRDYIRGYGEEEGPTRRAQEQEKIEKFIKGKGARRLTMINNPEKVIRDLRAARKRYVQNKLKMMKG